MFTNFRGLGQKSLETLELKVYEKNRSRKNMAEEDGDIVESWEDLEDNLVSKSAFCHQFAKIKLVYIDHSPNLHLGER